MSIRYETKRIMIMALLTRLSVTAPLNIINTLRKEQFKNLPDQKQISNFLSRHRKNENFSFNPIDPIGWKPKRGPKPKSGAWNQI
ncbi:hypothetical protein BpHYR1_048087 [Brachionus plicatilis]|uniref:Uncharacterized protein n=1 Tax=Brachionus plicatilis TaxID=10195 RepID=A0A3M7PXL8_BRAPC|nr:hypothetical protein BpHYR1_048087 [Brachionus plicatilis]